ncbi:MAG: DUF177 domain-containing protein [Chloroflexi bacterium]|nr:DUF177 domain-containing protein [Chloroflexota bacterium]
MIYNVAGLLSGELGRGRQQQLENERLSFGNHSFTEINGPVRMIRTDRTVLVSVDIEAVTLDTCGRCLEPATVNVSVTLEEEFSPANADLMGGSNDRPADYDDYYDPALVIDEQNFLDLSEALGQALSSAVPIAPLCKKECLGICPTCTINRNDIQCTCAQNTHDPRWGVLAGLLEKGAKSAD